jgi:hypothetical protein
MCFEAMMRQEGWIISVDATLGYGGSFRTMMKNMRRSSLSIGESTKQFARPFVIPPGNSSYARANGRDDYKGILARTGKGLDVKLLLNALQQSLEFEHYLEKRFSQTVPLIFAL